MTSTDEYRFLEECEIILSTDEFEDWTFDNTKRWIRTSSMYVGKKWMSSKLRPLRRRIEKKHPAEVF